MYAFAQRPDTTVVDEPLYAHYLTLTDSPTDHPGAEEVLNTMENDGNTVIKEVLEAPYSTPIVLFKQMTHHLIHLDLSFLQKASNVLLIRDPNYIIASYAKVSKPNMTDIGVAKQTELLDYLLETDRLDAVLDAHELLKAPQKVLTILCEKLDIPFYDSMLSWPNGARPEDGSWAKYWYENVQQSTGFKPFVAREIQLPADLQALAAACKPHYERLYQHAIKAD